MNNKIRTLKYKFNDKIITFNTQINYLNNKHMYWFNNNNSMFVAKNKSEINKMIKQLLSHEIIENNL